MLKQMQDYRNELSQPKVIAASRRPQKDVSLWIAVLATSLFAAAFYFSSFFFSFMGRIGSRH